MGLTNTRNNRIRILMGLALLGAGTASADPHPEVRYGQYGVRFMQDGRISGVSYYDANGNRLTSSTFNAAEILKKTERFGIDKSQLAGLGSALDSAGVRYKPYELYDGRSDHGIDLKDLANGGFGTAYDWTKDSNCAQKGPYACKQVAANKALAERLGIHKNTAVTSEKGLDPSLFPKLKSASGKNYGFVVYNKNGQTAGWYATKAEADAARKKTSGSQVIDVSDRQVKDVVPGRNFKDSSKSTASNEKNAMGASKDEEELRNLEKKMEYYKAMAAKDKMEFPITSSMGQKKLDELSKKAEELRKKVASSQGSSKNAGSSKSSSSESSKETVGSGSSVSVAGR